MTGSVIVKDYHCSSGYHCEQDYEKRFGGAFWFLIEPLYGLYDERFFYVKKLADNCYELSGEGYIISCAKRPSNRLNKLEKDLTGVGINYYFIDENGRVIRKEFCDSFLLDRWRELSDVSFDDNGDDLILAKNWFEFEKGTGRDKIWLYFDEKYTGGISSLVNNPV